LADITSQYRWIDVGLTDVLQGKYTDFVESEMNGRDEFYNVLYAQFAQAGYFPPV